MDFLTVIINRQLYEKVRNIGILMIEWEVAMMGNKQAAAIYVTIKKGYTVLLDYVS